MLPRDPLSPSELAMFRIVCGHPPEGATSAWVRSQIPARDKPPLAETTVTTLLDRVAKKGWMRAELKGKAFYFPNASIEEALSVIASKVVADYELDNENDLAVFMKALSSVSISVR